MLFALYFYVMSGSIEIDKFYTVTGNQMDCQRAMQSVEFGATGGLELELECTPYRNPPDGPKSTRINQFNQYAFVMATYNGNQATLEPTRAAVVPDAASCSNRIGETGKFYSNTSLRFIGVCFPEVK